MEKNQKRDNTLFNRSNSIFENTQNIYDKDYFENGVVVGKSCYQNYQWLPELTIRMAFNMIKHLQLRERDRVLDYGCAKGYLVKALRILDIEAFGCDISRYAIENIDAEVKNFCKLIDGQFVIPFDGPFDWIASKDVLEHLPNDTLDSLLQEAKRLTGKMFHVVPLGDGGVFRIPHYHDDLSHVQMQDEQWWRRKFEEHGWRVVRFDHKVKGIKENWTNKYNNGNGFFVLEGV